MQDFLITVMCIPAGAGVMAIVLALISYYRSGTFKFWER